MNFVLAPRSSFKYLLSSFRKDDPFFDVKLVSKEDLFRSIYPSVNDDCLLYLVKEKGLSFEIADLYLRYIPYVNNDFSNKKIHLLFELKEELAAKGLLVNSKTDYRNSTCDIYYYSELDKELLNLLKEANISYRFIKNDINKEFDLYEFNRIEDEVYFVLNRIASLIDSGVNINDIFIVNRNNEYDYYLKKFAPYFGYQVNSKSSVSLYSSGAVKEFLKIYESTKDISSSLEELKELMKEDPLYLEVEDVVSSNIIEDLSFELQKEFFVRKFKNRALNNVKFNNAVNVIDSPMISEGKHYFVIGFAQGLYPSISKSSQYLNDKELLEINRLNNKERTRIDAEELISSFNSSNNVTLSISKQSKSTSFYPSPLANLIKINKHEVNLDDVFYSKDAAKLIYSDLTDTYHFYKEEKDDYLRLNGVSDIEYNNYDNQYKDKANVYNENSKIHLSTSSLEKYSNCPFGYYLEKIVKLESFEGNFSTYLGNIAHELIEHSRNKYFNFEQEFNDLTKNLDLSVSERYCLNHRLKEKILEAINAIKLREEGYENPTIKNELSVSYNLTPNTLIEGRIDNFVTFDDKYYICIDYKTGNTKFESENLKYGLSSQLPTYSLLINNTDKYKDLEVIGLYINNIIDKSLKVDTNPDKIINPFYKLNGKTIDIIDQIKLIDPTIDSGESVFINGIKISKDGSIKSKAAITKEDFEIYQQIVKEKYIEMDKALRDNDFTIRPYFLSDRQKGCTYCQYKDVCFVKNEQFNRLKEEEDE